MRPQIETLARALGGRRLASGFYGQLLLTLAVVAPGHAVAPRTYPSPQAALNAFVAAIRKGDVKALQAILGPEGRRIPESGDVIADKAARKEFLTVYDEKHNLLPVSSTKQVVYLGKLDWPYPVPIEKGKSGWYFDAVEGREEILARRIGRNESSTIKFCAAYYDAQREYATRVVQPDGTVAYAEQFASDPDTHNGLYWPTEPGETPSPMGPRVAQAKGEGYAPNKPGKPKVPYHGYLFNILKKQGRNAKGGAYDYVIRGKMMGGFGVVAYPAVWGSSGVMTFIVSHDGVIYQKNLQEGTTALAAAMTTLNPDSTWKPIRKIVKDRWVVVP